MKQRSLVTALVIVLGALLVALLNAWPGKPGRPKAMPTGVDVEVRIEVPDHALSPVVQADRAEALEVDPSAAAASDVRIKVCSEGGHVLEGVSVYARMGNARVYPASELPVGLSDSNGICVVDAEDCKRAVFLAFHHDQHTPLRVAASKLTPGVLWTVFLQPSHEYTVRVVDPMEKAVVGARVLASRRSLGTSAGWLSSANGVPGADPEIAIFTAMTNEDGEAVLRGLQGDCEYAFHVRAAGMLALAGIETPIKVLEESLRVVQMGYVYGGVVKVEGDRIVTAHEVYTRDFHAPVLDHYMVRPLREDLEARYPGALCLVGVPALADQEKGAECEFTLAVFGRTSGWVTRRMVWRPLDRIVPTTLVLPRGGSDMAGRVVCKVETPTGRLRTDAVVACLMYNGANRVESHLVKIRGDDEERVLPAGEYEVIGVNPFIEFSADTLSLGPAAAVELVGMCRREVVCATIRVEVSPGEWASAFSMEIVDETSGVAWRGRDLQDGVKVLLPRGVPLRVNYGVAGWEPRTAQVTLGGAQSEIIVSVTR